LLSLERVLYTFPYAKGLDN